MHVQTLARTLTVICRYTSRDWISALIPLVGVLERHEDPGAQAAGKFFGAGLGVLSHLRKDTSADEESLAMRAAGFFEQGYAALQSFKRARVFARWPEKQRFENEVMLLERLGALCTAAQQAMQGRPGAAEELEALSAALIGSPKPA